LQEKSTQVCNEKIELLEMIVVPSEMINKKIVYGLILFQFYDAITWMFHDKFL